VILIEEKLKNITSLQKYIKISQNFYKWFKINDICDQFENILFKHLKNSAWIIKEESIISLLCIINKNYISQVKRDTINKIITEFGRSRS